MNISDFSDIKKILDQDTPISFNDSFEITSFCSKSLNNGSTRKAREYIIRILDKIDRFDKNCRPILNDLVDASGLFPYLDSKDADTSTQLRYEYHRSRYLPNVIFHAEQAIVSSELTSGKSIVLSAPTSFGKSLVIEEIVASKKYNNIVIIQPTLALLDETRKKLKKYENTYKLIVTTNQEPSVDKNLYLFTAERVVEYNQFPIIDFFIIDEFYKLSISRDDERSVVLNHALYKLLRMTQHFYMLGPVVKSIPHIFIEKFGNSWIHTDFQTVAVNEIDLRVDAKTKKDERKEKLFKLLQSLKEQSLIYCSSPNKATSLAIEYATSREIGYHSRKNDERISEIIEWIQENIHPNWGLVESLEKGVAFHHSSIPRHLGSTIVDLFNAGSIDTLFCTSTLIEGVNTSAKNVILFDKKKGIKDIDYFDYKNIAGRSGRMNKYFIGNVYRFHGEPTQLELEVDIPIFTQGSAPMELLVQLDKEDVVFDRREEMKEFWKLDKKLQDIIKLNSSIYVNGQIALVNELLDKAHYYHTLISWNRFPKYEELTQSIRLCWKYFLKPKDNKAGISSPEQLAVLTFQYQNLKSLAGMIHHEVESDYMKSRYPEDKIRINECTAKILSVTRNWFDFRLPKFLKALSNLQQYVFTKVGLGPGNYSYYCEQIENGFVPSNYSLILEYDIPLSAIKKMERLIRADMKADELVSTIKRANIDAFGLSRYEKRKIQQL